MEGGGGLQCYILSDPGTATLVIGGGRGWKGVGWATMLYIDGSRICNTVVEVNKVSLSRDNLLATILSANLFEGLSS